MAERHKHADLIIAWANGAEIEVKSPATYDADCRLAKGCILNESAWKWDTIPNPSWDLSKTYRIKPKPDYTLVCNLRAYGDQKDPVPNRYHYGDVLCTFDGETNKIKEIRVPK